MYGVRRNTSSNQLTDQTTTLVMRGRLLLILSILSYVYGSLWCPPVTPFPSNRYEALVFQKGQEVTSYMHMWIDMINHRERYDYFGLDGLPFQSIVNNWGSSGCGGHVYSLEVGPDQKPICTKGLIPSNTCIGGWAVPTTVTCVSNSTIIPGYPQPQYTWQEMDSKSNFYTGYFLDLDPPSLVPIQVTLHNLHCRKQIIIGDLRFSSSMIMFTARKSVAIRSHCSTGSFHFPTIFSF